MGEMDILGEVKYLTCNVCARRCYLTPTLGTKPVGGGKPERTFTVSGNSCSNGLDYAHTELLDPRRVITTSVGTLFPDMPRLRVTSLGGVPVDRLLEAMAALDGVTVAVRLKPGDIVVEDLLGLGIPVVVA